MALVTISHSDLVNGELVISNPQTVDPSICPHFIFSPEHYRVIDGKPGCDCGTVSATYMRRWGYRWSKREQRWK